MRITFRMPDCDDWTDEAIATLPLQDRSVKITNRLRWDEARLPGPDGGSVADGKIVAAVRDGHDALVTVEVPDDAAVVRYLHAMTSEDRFSIGDHATSVETSGDVEVAGMCSFVRVDTNRLTVMAVSAAPTAVPPPDQWKRSDKSD